MNTFINLKGIHYSGQAQVKMCCYLGYRIHYWRSGTPKRAPELLAHGIREGIKIAQEKYENQTIDLPSIETYEDQSLIIVDLFWICGKERLLPIYQLDEKEYAYQ